MLDSLLSFLIVFPLVVAGLAFVNRKTALFGPLAYIGAGAIMLASLLLLAIPLGTKPVLVAAGVVLAFLGGVPPVYAASAGAAILLISRTRDPRKLYAEIDWGLLVFFVGLFIIVGGAENAGIVNRLFRFSERWNLHSPAVFTIATALFSNLVSNVPAVMLLKSLAPGFQDPHHAWLVLAMASTLAGNLTITGSIANIIVVERSRPAVHVGFWEYFRVGLPVTATTLLVGWLWLRWVP